MSEEVKNIPTQIIEKMKAKSIDVGRLSQLSGVSERYINLFVEGKIDDLPAEPYVRGYIRKISEILELDKDALWQEFLDRTEEVRKSEDADKKAIGHFNESDFCLMVSRKNPVNLSRSL